MGVITKALHKIADGIYHAGKAGKGWQWLCQEAAWYSHRAIDRLDRG
jgi:hypothetical protein